MRNLIKKIKKLKSGNLLHILDRSLDHSLFKPISISIIVSFLIFNATSYIKNILEDKKAQSLYQQKLTPIKINIPKDNNFNITEEQTTYYKVKSGDTLLKILLDNGVLDQEAFQILNSLKKVYDPKLITAGDNINLKYQLKITADDIPIPNNTAGNISRHIKINKIIISPSLEEEIIVQADNQNEYHAKIVKQILTKHIVKYSGVIKNSLFEDGVKSGIAPTTMIKMINLYSYDVDFQRDIKEDDKFEMLVESFYTKDGKKVRDGEVLFSSLELQQRAIDIYMHKINGEIEYFDAKGNSTKKSLLRTPVNGARISSKFGMRHHPILGFTRMHKGVDFAAPVGTPILAAGNGKIVFIGKRGGYGNYVRVRHNSEYETAYAHASRFASNLHIGSKVKQGQVIAYIGTTGLSKGPHLHFELLYRGSQINPSKVKSTPGIKLSGKELVKFEASKAEIDRYRKNSPNQIAQQ